jgi:hypothetical protein
MKVSQEKKPPVPITDRSQDLKAAAEAARLRRFEDRRRMEDEPKGANDVEA